MPCAARIIEAAKEIAAAANYDNLGTFEFLVDNDAKASEQAFAFIEANPRLQVEHTVTEEVLGLDLVQSQLAVAAGATLARELRLMSVVSAYGEVVWLTAVLALSP